MGFIKKHSKCLVITILITLVILGGVNIYNNGWKDFIKMNVQVKGAPDAVAVEQLDKAAVLQTAVIIAHRQHLMLAAGEAGVNDLRFGVVHKQSLLFCQNLFEIRPQHIQCRGGIL